MPKFRLLILAALLASPQALASPELARSRNCAACHHAERKQIGPAYSAIAARYAGNPAALETLSARVIAGGGGNWGPTPMPAQAIPPADAETLVRWILTLQ